MLNLLRSDLYRLAHQPQTWVMAGVSVALCVLVVVMLAWVASPDFAAYVNDQTTAEMERAASEAERAEIEADTQEALAEVEPLNGKVMPSMTYTWANSLLSGGFLGIMGSIMVVLFLSADFKGGFMRSLVMDRRGRLRYYVEKLVFAAIIQALLLALCVLVTAAAFAMCGFTYQTIDTAGEVALWLVLAWLVMCTYAFIVSCIMWLTRSEWMGGSCAVAISSGILGLVVVSVVQLLSLGLPWLAEVPHLIPFGCVQLLGNGAAPLFEAGAAPVLGLPPVGAILVVEAVYLALSIAVVLGVCRRKDI